ncbi:hypothetical protein J2Y38_004775 [Flavobacterium sp. 2755]|uniref:hypothetical protein n=1 Tax=Flavobacterium sp. 2755 TaxID=2817765 RepID=UPI0028667B83|nr:hypothetical protein [Flavobacterium sp. 2755]MDR6764542.1 hypothetical protein [Flavobacterium sp. 2755]
MSFNFVIKENPYSDNSSKYLIWGRILLIIDNKIIIDYEWDILEVIEWFFNKKEHLLEKFVFKKDGFSSIAEIRDHLYDSVDYKTPLDYIEKLEDYFSNHIFRLKGTSLGIYYIGIFDNKLGQISFKRDNDFFCYEFDMNKFIKETELKIYDTTRQWNKSFYKTVEATSKLEELKKTYSF